MWMVFFVHLNFFSLLDFIMLFFLDQRYATSRKKLATYGSKDQLQGDKT